MYFPKYAELRLKSDQGQYTVILFEDGFNFMISKNFVSSALKAVGFLHSYTCHLEGKHADLLIIKSIMEEDNFHDLGMKSEKIVAMQNFVNLFFKDTGSPYPP